MKIFHLSNSDISGGAARATNRIHQALLEKGIKSQMLVNKKISRDENIFGPRNFIEKILVDLRPYISNFVIKFFKIHKDIPYSISLFPSPWIDRINKSDADLVHLHWVQHEMLSIADIGRIEKPIVWTLHDMWAFCGAEHLAQDDRWRLGYSKNDNSTSKFRFDINRWTWLRKLKNWQKSIYIVTPSNWLACCARESKLMGNWPVSVVPNLLNTDNWKPKDKNIARKTLGLPLDIPLAIFGTHGANSSHHKGFDLLLETLNNIKNKDHLKNLEFVIFGKNTLKFLPKINFPTHFVGHLDDDSLINLYSSADVTIIPSRQEAFCQTASESQACGTPVVAFKIGGLTDIVERQKTGYLAKAFDTQDLAKGITWVLEKKHELSLCKQSRTRALEKFSQKILVEKYQAIYEKVLNNKV